MSSFEEKAYRVFELFQKDWALAAAGDMACSNACTIGWGSMGTMWTRPGSTGQVMTVYLHPARYTTEFFDRNAYFTVCFFPKEYRKALSYMGSHSGREGDKAAAAGLTPVPAGQSIAYEEAELVFVCRKLYGHSFDKADLAEEIREYYRAHPTVYPVDEEGQWQPHRMYVGEIVEVIDQRKA